MWRCRDICDARFALATASTIELAGGDMLQAGTGVEHELHLPAEKIVERGRRTLVRNVGRLDASAARVNISPARCGELPLPADP